MSTAVVFRAVRQDFQELKRLETEFGGGDQRVQSLARQLLNLEADGRTPTDSATATATASSSTGANLELAVRLIKRDDIFSSNETLDDVNTGDLCYLLAHFFYGSVFLKLMVAGDAASAKRIEHLKRARTHLSVFIGRAKQLGLVSDKELEVWFGLLSSRAAASAQLGDHAPQALEQARQGMTPQAKRQYKIERFQREKETAAQLAYLAEKRRKAGHADHENDENDSGFDDESEWRQFELLQIEAALLDASALLESAAQELEMLEHIEQRRRDVGEHRMRADMERERAEARAAEPARANVTIMPGQLAALERRQQLAAQVMRPGWTQATYTPEEAAMLDMQEGNFLSGGANDAEADESEDEDADIDNPDKLRKAREWDDFKDDNPRGQGNQSRKG